MELEDLKNLSRQLSCPTGDGGIVLGHKMNETNEFITNKSIDVLAPAAGENITEIGFGNGVLSQRIIDSIGDNGKFTGIEKSHTLAKQAHEYFCCGDKSNITIHSTNYSEVDINNNSIDGILAVNLLYFIDDTHLFFKKLYNWLKPGGRIIVGIRSPQTLKKMPFTQFYFKLRSESEVITSMSDSGFTHVDTQYYDEGVTSFNEMIVPVDALIIKAIKKI